MEKEIKIEFQVKGIEIIEFQLSPPSNPKQVIKTFNYKINIEHKIIEEKKWFVNQVYIEIYGDSEEEVILGKLKTAMSFEVNNFSDFVDKESKAINIPENIIITFNSVAISTTRGIMFSQFRGTHLHNAILPIVDPNSFKKQKK